jgi:hypothetical protein
MARRRRAESRANGICTTQRERTAVRYTRERARGGRTSVGREGALRGIETKKGQPFLEGVSCVRARGRRHPTLASRGAGRIGRDV